MTEGDHGRQKVGNAMAQLIEAYIQAIALIIEMLMK
jgi:hypothetical protein